LKYGRVRYSDIKLFKPYSKVSRLITKVLLPLTKERRRKRSKLFEDILMKNKSAFVLRGGSLYKVDSEIAL